MREAHEPEILIWENLGQSFWHKLLIFSIYLFLACAFIAIGFTIFWSTAVVEKMRIQYIKSDCNGQDFFTEKEAYQDL